MILTCPDCSTRYSVKDDAIGPNGRTVRCSNCHASWFVSEDADALALTDNQEEILTPVVERSEAKVEPEKTDIPRPVMGAHVQIRDKADRERRRRRMMGVSMIWGITLGLLLLAAILAYVFRQNIVDQSPGMASLYKAFNIPVKVNGLDFEDPATRNIMIDGRPVLVVNGVIVNRSNETRELPLIELSLVSNSGQEITKWLVEPSKDKLAPKERMEYVSQYPNPPLDATDLEYRFVDDSATDN